MKKRLKKITAGLLSVLIAVGMLSFAPVAATAAETARDSVGASSGTTGDCTWTIDDNRVLTISGNGEMGDFESGSRPGGYVESVIIEDGVTNIGNYLCFNNSWLKSVTIPDSVTRIGKYAFSGCRTLTSITIPDSVTYIGEWAFQGCTGLNAVYISDIEAWCGITFADWYCNPLICAHNLYLNNELVTDITLPDGITAIRSFVFQGCSCLTGVTIPDSVTQIGGSAFNDCTNMTRVDIPDGVTEIGSSAFRSCRSLQQIALPDNVSIGTCAFDSCQSLTSIIIPDSVT